MQKFVDLGLFVLYNVLIITIFSIVRYFCFFSVLYRRVKHS